MKKLMDEEIIKALECCGKEYSCERCILNTWLNKKRDCVGKILGGALDLINRQKAEIERLNIELQSMRSAANSYKMHYELAKFEAIKEFAKRLKSKLANLSVQTVTHGRKTTPNYVDDIANQILHDVVPKETDNLVKEMTEE